MISAVYLPGEGVVADERGLTHIDVTRVCCIQRSQVIFAGRFTASSLPSAPGPHGEAWSAPPRGTRTGFRQ